LRSSWGFKGFVVSDCDAISDIYTAHAWVSSPAEASARALTAGNDLNCGSYYKNLDTALALDLVGEEHINRALARVFAARFKLGLFDDPAQQAYTKIPYAMVDSPAHRSLARLAARQSIVLLKNNGILPLTSSIKKIAVIGPYAQDEEVLLGNYHGTPSHISSVLAGLRSALAAKQTLVYSEGVAANENYRVVSGTYLRNREDESNLGLAAAYFPNKSLSGIPILQRIDQEVNFDWEGRAAAPGIGPDNFSVRWTGFLVAPVSGIYSVGVKADDGFRLFLDEQPIVDDWSNHAAYPALRSINLEAGHSYRLALEYYQAEMGSSAQLIWQLPRDEQGIEKALAVARESDVVVLVLGLSQLDEGEETDRRSLALPGQQSALLAALLASPTPVVLVTLGGSPLDLSEADQGAAAILHAWYPGQDGGAAIADVVFGSYNPAGRLPVTFPGSAEMLPSFTDYSMQGRTYRFSEKPVLYPFGFGLSYARFSYEKLEVTSPIIEAGNPLAVSVQIANISTRAGDEVVQFYLRPLELASNYKAPLISLKKFSRIHILPGATEKIAVTLSPQDLAVLDENNRWVIAAGKYMLYAAAANPLGGRRVPMQAQMIEISGSKILDSGGW
jgi:beta-glucosidase